MRDSVGAAWVFGICLTFIIMFTAYLAISLNYAKAFRVKNHVISMIEENGGYEEDKLESKIKDYIYSQGLTATGTCQNRIATDFDDKWEPEPIAKIALNDTGDDKYNVCIYKSLDRSQGDTEPAERYIYRVVTFFRFDIPVVRYFSSFQVAGESRYIYDYVYGV